MKKPAVKYFLFLPLTLVLSVPFYLWGAFFPVVGLPFGLPISFLMIFVPFLLSLLYAWKENGEKGIAALFKGIFDVGCAQRWAVVFCLVCMPLAAVLSYVVMRLVSLPLPAETAIPYRELPLMLVLYFLGAIPEEFGWTATLTEPLTKVCALIGSVWAVWHIISWSWAHPAWWIAGMCVLNVLMRTAMLYAYLYGGKSLFTGLIFHTMINVATGVFPNSGSHFNPWIFSIWTAVLLLWEICLIKRKVKAPAF